MPEGKGLRAAHSMKQMWRRRGTALLLGVLVLVGAGAGLTLARNAGAQGSDRATKHVLLISVDGLHQTDLMWYLTLRRG
jgi:hypothetical protein